MSATAIPHEKQRFTNDAPPSGTGTNRSFSEFSLFSRLPPEIRLMIWENTWPGPRAIEVASRPVEDAQGEEDEGVPGIEALGDDWSDDEETDYIYLRPVCSLSTWLQHDFGARIIEEEPVEECPNPVALRVCHESRTLTLQRYSHIQHPNYASSSFYLDSGSDVLCLVADVDEDNLALLQRRYGDQLANISTILVEEMGWWENLEKGWKSLSYFQGLNVVQVLLDHDPDDDASDSGRTMTIEEYAAVAKELRERDVWVLGSTSWMVRYMDRKCNVYASLRLPNDSPPMHTRHAIRSVS